MRRTKKEIMEGVEAVNSRVIDNNTIEYTDSKGNKVIRLHLTDIIVIKPNGDVILNSGSWKTPTTKARINQYQNVAHIYQEKSVWYVKTDEMESIFYDGITIKADGRILKPERVTNIPKILKLINAYCKKLSELDKLPEPSTGDCMYCLLVDSEGNPIKDTQHLMSHLREKYIHGSLIVNAMRDAGYRDNSIGLVFYSDFFPRSSVVSSVRKYFKKQLGIPY